MLFLMLQVYYHGFYGLSVGTNRCFLVSFLVLSLLLLPDLVLFKLLVLVLSLTLLQLVCSLWLVRSGCCYVVDSYFLFHVCFGF